MLRLPARKPASCLSIQEDQTHQRRIGTSTNKLWPSDRSNVFHNGPSWSLFRGISRLHMDRSASQETLRLRHMRPRDKGRRSVFLQKGILWEAGLRRLCGLSTCLRKACAIQFRRRLGREGHLEKTEIGQIAMDVWKRLIARDFASTLSALCETSPS